MQRGSTRPQSAARRVTASSEEETDLTRQLQSLSVDAGPSSSASPSPSPSDLASIDAHVDSGSDADHDADDTDDALSDGGGGDSGDDGDELLDVPLVSLPVRGEEKTSSLDHPSSSSLLPSSATTAATSRIWLCPSRYGRPSCIFFDYPASFHMTRSQPRIPCDRPLTLRYLHADSACIYNSITGTLKRAGFVEQTGESRRELSQWNVRWGKHLLPEAFKELRPYHKINHFPGTGGIGRKDRLARNISRARRRFGAHEFNFLPETFLLPADRSLWEMRFAAEPPGTLWIAKPNSSSCGRGIKVVSKLSDIPPKRSCIVSRYIAAPLLVDGRKFDLRLYVLVTSFHPLKIYWYNNGLARFCTSKYSTSKRDLNKRFMHLTNWSVNKRSTAFVMNNAEENLEQGEDGGDASKWSLYAFKRWLLRTYGAERSAAVWASVVDVLIKTLLSVETGVSSNVSRLGSHRDQAFELFGFDVLLDDQLKPWLMEVNCAPSLSSSSPLDKRIKNELLTDTFHTIGIKPAYIKEKGDKDKERGKSRGDAAGSTSATASARAVARSSSAGAPGANESVVRGSTMGPSNARNTRAAMSPLVSPGGSNGGASGHLSPSAGGGASDASGGGMGRVAQLKSIPPSQLFSSLSKSDLNLLRDFRDELTRAHSGGWRVIFPVGTGGVAGGLRPGADDEEGFRGAVGDAALSSFDAYSHLFEVEKYDTLLLMLFQKHLDERAQENVCQGLQPDGSAPRAKAQQSKPRAASGNVLSPSNASRQIASRAASTNTKNTAARAQSAVAPTSALRSPSPASSSPVSASSSPSSSPSARRIDLTRRSSGNAPVISSNAFAAERTAAAASSAADSAAVSRLVPLHPSSPVVQLGRMPRYNATSAAELDRELQTRSHTAEHEPASPLEPISASADDSTEHSRARRHYFDQRGVALQAFAPREPQYRQQGWMADAAAVATEEDGTHAAGQPSLSPSHSPTSSPPRGGSLRGARNRSHSAGRYVALSGEPREAVLIADSRSPLSPTYFSPSTLAAPFASALAAAAAASHGAPVPSQHAHAQHVRSRSNGRNSTGMVGLDGIRALATSAGKLHASHSPSSGSGSYHFARPFSSSLSRASAAPQHAGETHESAAEEMASQHFFSHSLGRARGGDPPAHSSPHSLAAKLRGGMRNGHPNSGVQPVRAVYFQPPAVLAAHRAVQSNRAMINRSDAERNLF